MADTYFAGVDEVGRGPIAGPVCVGLVSWKKKDQRKILKELEGIRDSKKLSEKKREEYFRKIKKLKKEGLLFYTHSMISAKEIDRAGISKAISKAVSKCSLKIKNLNKVEIFLDGGLKAPEEFRNQKTITKGDDLIPIISTASVVAKVLRDREMIKFDSKYRGYDFSSHKGYGTKAHYKAIKKRGETPIHRKTYIH